MTAAPDGFGSGHADPPGRGTFVTAQQAKVHTLYQRYRNMSDVARELGLSQIRVREALVQYQRNRMRDEGLRPPSLKEMQRGDVTPRFGVSRQELHGRPAKHLQTDPVISRSVQAAPTGRPIGRETAPVAAIAAPEDGVRRLVVTAVEPGAPIHQGFWSNLQAYAARMGAGMMVLRIGSTDLAGPRAHGSPDGLVTGHVDVAGLIDVAGDLAVAPRLSRPLDATRHRARCAWTVVPHPAVQLETLARVRADGLRVQLTTGSLNVARVASGGGWRSDLGAVIVEVAADGAAFCRHIQADPDGDGSFQDLGVRAAGGATTSGHRVEALSFGDIHHAHMDAGVAAATWGIGRDGRDRERSLVDQLRPVTMVFHDVCDFDARSPFDARDHLKRFAQSVQGGGDVREEMAAAARFLAATRRRWSSSVVVHSNHDDMLVRWLRDTDFRDDPGNAVFYLETSLALHRRILAGLSTDGIFAETLGRLGGDGLRGVRFLETGESLRIAGVECGVHGHQGADGRRGDLRSFERLGTRLTMGHTHRPTTRDGVVCAGVCQTGLDYARGALTAWAVGHVVTYDTGARQHLFHVGGRFFA